MPAAMTSLAAMNSSCFADRTGNPLVEAGCAAEIFIMQIAEKGQSWQSCAFCVSGQQGISAAMFDAKSLDAMSFDAMSFDVMSDIMDPSGILAVDISDMPKVPWAIISWVIIS